MMFYLGSFLQKIEGMLGTSMLSSNISGVQCKIQKYHKHIYECVCVYIYM